MKFALSAVAVTIASFGLLTAPLDAAHAPRVLAAYYCGECDPVPPAIASMPAVLNVVIYAFGEPGNGDVCHAPNPLQVRQFAELRALRRLRPGLRLLVSIGGWAAAPQYSDAALTARSRAAFAASCVGWFVERNDFDGIDVDWEFPVRGGVPQNPRRPQDRRNATLLLGALRSRLDELGLERHRHYLLTVATPAGTWQYGGAYSAGQSYDLAAVARVVDWLNVMTYDMNNVFSPVSSFNTPMYADARDPTPEAQRRLDNVTAAVQYYEQHGVPAQKIVLGAAFYGRGFTGVSSRDSGLYSHYAGGFPETPWKAIESRFLTDPNWQRHWSSSAEAPWLFNARRHLFLSYDDPRSMRIKGEFVRQAGLRGAMFWVYGEDDARDSLLNALAQGMGM